MQPRSILLSDTPSGEANHDVDEEFKQQRTSQVENAIPFRLAGSIARGNGFGLCGFRHRVVEKVSHSSWAPSIHARVHCAALVNALFPGQRYNRKKRFTPAELRGEGA